MRLELRLQQEVNSYSSAVGDAVSAVLIAPVIVDGQWRIAPGAKVYGNVSQVRRVGLGVRRETALLALHFDRIQLEDGTLIPIQTKLYEIENAREKVDPSGRIHGIRSTNTPGFRASGLLTSFAAVDPIALIFSSAAFASILRFSEPEIRLAPGTEMVVRLLDASVLPPPIPPPLVGLPVPFPEPLLRSLPARTQTPERGLLSDMTNLIFVGEPEAILRAFVAAGWHTPSPITPATRFLTVRAMAENQEYKDAPMSLLLLNGEAPVQTWAKALNTFAKRHHLRVYATGETWQGQPVFSAAATQDVSINFSRGRGVFTHLIDANIDRERSKVMHDLLFTGCISAAEAISRPWLPEKALNATGQELLTDRAATVLVFNDCLTRRAFDEAVAEPRGPYRGSRFTRALRQTVLTFRNDIYRGNLIYQGLSIGNQSLRHFRSSRKSLQRVPGPTMTARTVKPPSTLSDSSQWAAPSVELGFYGGAMVFSHSTVGAEGIVLNLRSMPGQTLELSAANRISPGFALGGMVTLNSHRWVSHELGFGYQRGQFQMDLQGVTDFAEQQTGYLTRQVGYNTLVYLRPPESRWRPYFAGGPVLQLAHLTDAPFEKARGLFRFGLNNVGMFKAAYNFGSAAPLEGGGIFQLGLQMGAGLKYRLTEHWTLRLDYRNTCSPPPDLIRKSLPPQIMPDHSSRGRIAQQRLSLGFAFTF